MLIRPENPTSYDQTSAWNSYSYNAFNMPTEIDYPTDTDVTFQYDAVGRRTTMVDGSGTTTWTYNTIGQMVSNTQSRTGTTLSYGYDVQGNRTEMELTGAGAARTTDYNYDPASRLEIIQDAPGSSYQYHYETGTGRVAEILMPNGAKVTKGYDALGRLTNTAYLGVNGQTLKQVGYGYNAASQRISETGIRGNVTFGYDEKRQLTSASGLQTPTTSNQELTYDYDEIGNWEAGQTIENGILISKELDANQVNQYTSITSSPNPTITPTYDNNGNMTSDGNGATLTYDQENRLVAWEKGTKRSEFVYDGMGKKVEKKEFANGSLSSTERYVYNGTQIIAALDGSNQMVSSFSRGLDLTGTLDGVNGIGGLLSINNSGQSANYFADGNGNVVNIFNNTDQALASYAFDPFGNKISSTGLWADVNPFQWSSQVYLQESGLIGYVLRLYSSKLSRWLNRDPIEEEGGMNLYCFVANNPVGSIDILGLGVYSVGSLLDSPPQSDAGSDLTP